MKRFAIALLSLINLASAKPTFPYIPLSYPTTLTPGVHVEGASSRVLDNPHVAHYDERVNLFNANSRLAVPQVQQHQRRSTFLINDYPPTLTSPAPLGPDGRVVDTAEVAAAKAAHEAAHVNERLKLASEATRSRLEADGDSDLPETTDSVIVTEATVGPDGRVQDTPEVAAARAAHEATYVNERLINLANDAARTSGIVLTRVMGSDGFSVTPLVFGDDVIAALVPVGIDGRLTIATPEVDRNLQKDVQSVDALAVAGPTLAYGRLIYQGRT